MELEICDRDCFHCKYGDCIVDGLTLEDYKVEKEIDRIAGVAGKGTGRKEYYSNYYREHRAEILEKKRKQCHAGGWERQKKYCQGHQERARAYRREYYLANQERARAYQRQYYREHREEIAAKQRQRYSKNREKILERQKAYNKARREAEKEEPSEPSAWLIFMMERRKKWDR